MHPRAPTTAATIFNMLFPFPRLLSVCSLSSSPAVVLSVLWFLLSVYVVDGYYLKAPTTVEGDEILSMAGLTEETQQHLDDVRAARMAEANHKVDMVGQTIPAR